ncbi:MAG: MBL fold metallo-hydrolase [Bryobacteraceae bacterium]|jgi:L-ascorbate metabolism protein UlaG (beta-lactamase superfamily)
MSNLPLRITYIGGPTALLELAGLRLLTDPTFDPPGEYTMGPVTLRKTSGPAVPAESVNFDVVLLSHDHHSDNLDHLGRAALARAQKVFTTEAGAERLGGNAMGLAAWASVDVPTPDGRLLRVTGTPARHGPEGGDRGPVTGFLLQLVDAPDSAVYVSGDTVWYDSVNQIRQRARVDRAVLFMGAVRVPEVGPAHLTMSAADGIQFARAFPDAAIIPLHFEGWRHFSESRPQIAAAFAEAGLENRLHWIELGRAIDLA